MARKKTNEGTEISTAQTNTNEQANAPKESMAQQSAQQTIAEGSATVNVGANPANPASGATKPSEAAPAVPSGGTSAVEKASQPEPMKPAVASTQAEGGAKTTADAPRTDRDRTPQEKSDAAKVASDTESAKAAGVEMLKLTVDGVDVEVPKGTLVIEAAFQAGADIPYFCYHPRLTSVGACRMCLASVELEMFGQRRASIMATCTVPCSAGMVIKTNTPDVKKAQNGILEFLLANHPLDCPICDRGGECPLQNMTIAYGPPTSRYIEEKRHFPKAMPISDYVVLDRERCIQCMRCTRFCEEIGGDGQLAVLNRGSSSEIGTFFGHDFSSNFSGNTIEICPVGALTSRSYRFAGRPWEIKSTDSICSKCGNGCNVAVQSRLGDLVRVNGRTNEDINEEWTCDRGKFGQYYVNAKERLVQPLIRDAQGRLVPESTWDQALIAIQKKIRIAEAHRTVPDSIAGIASTRCTVEDNYLFGRLMRGLVGTNNIDHQMQPYPFEPMQTSIAAIQEFQTIVSVGMKLDFDQPIVYLRVYKATRKRGAEWIQADSIDNSVADALVSAGDKAVLLLPHHLDPAEIARARALCARTGAKAECSDARLQLLGSAAGRCLAAVPAGDEDILPRRRRTSRKAGTRLCRVRRAKPPPQIFAGVASGSVKMLYVMGSDPVTKYQDSASCPSRIWKPPSLS